jgi:hypothetical protein
LTGYSTNINRVCYLNSFTINKVVKPDGTNYDASFVSSHFSIAAVSGGTAKFTVTSVADIVKMSKVYITAVTVGGVSTPSHHALNVEINELCG